MDEVRNDGRSPDAKTHCDLLIFSTLSAYADGERRGLDRIGG